MKLPVRIWGMDALGHPFSQPATTETISASEACVCGVTAQVKLDDVIGLSYAGRKGRFRVVAMGAAASLNPGQIILNSVDNAQNLWAVDFSPRLEIQDPAERGERRTVARYHCKAAISIWQETSPHPLHAGVSDLSLRGCYVDLTFALPVGTKITLGLNISGVVIRASGEVCTSHPAVGMGVRFDSMPDADRQKLEEIVASLAMSSEVPESSAD